MNNHYQQLQQVRKLPDFPHDYLPSVIEYFDQDGLLMGETLLGSYEELRPLGHRSLYFAIYFDGQLGFFIEYEGGNNVLLNRIHKMTQFTQLIKD